MFGMASEFVRPTVVCLLGVASEFVRPALLALFLDYKHWGRTEIWQQGSGDETLCSIYCCTPTFRALRSRGPGLACWVLCHSFSSRSERLRSWGPLIVVGGSAGVFRWTSGIAPIAGCAGSGLLCWTLVRYGSACLALGQWWSRPFRNRRSQRLRYASVLGSRISGST